MEIESLENPNSLLELKVDSSLKQSLGELVDMLDILGIYSEFEKSYLTSLGMYFHLDRCV